MKDFLLNSAEAVQGAQESTLTYIIEFAILAILVVALWRLFVKAGEPGWKAIVPILNIYTLCLLSTGSGCLLIILMCIPGINIIAGLIVSWNLAKSFGRGELFAIGIFFLPAIFIPILAFSDSSYIGPRGVRIFSDFGGYNQYQGFGNYSNSQSGGSYQNYQGYGSSNGNSYGKPYGSQNSEFDVDIDDFDEKDAKTVDFEVEQDNK